MRMSAPPDHASTEQLVLKLCWSHAGMQRHSEVKFSSLQSDDMQLTLGLTMAVHLTFLLRFFLR